MLDVCTSLFGDFMSRFLINLQHANVRVAVGILQPAVLPDGDHAEHRQEERAPIRQGTIHINTI